MSKVSKEIEKRMLVKRTINEMNRHINSLKEQKKKYIEAAKVAKQKNLTAQLNLAISALKNVMLQEQRATEMLLNFEITSGMKDMAEMTSGFLKGMGVLSREMSKLTNNKDFVKVQKEFENAMVGMEVRTEQIDAFLDMNQASFADSASNSRISDDEIYALVEIQASNAEGSAEEDIDAELAKLKEKLTPNKQ